MATYTLSVVQLCPDTHKAAAEAIAEAAGYGPNNLSVELLDANGNIWWGCHAWWQRDAWDAYTPPTGDDAADEILSHVITSVQIGGDPRAHWVATIAEYGLQEVTCSEC